MSRLFIRIRSDLPNGSWVIDADQELEFEVICEGSDCWPYVMSATVQFPTSAEAATVRLHPGMDMVESDEEVRTCKKQRE